MDISAGFESGRFGGDYAYSILGANGFTGSVGVSNTYIGADARFGILKTRNGEVIRGTCLSVRAAPAAAFVAFLGVMSAN